VGAPVVSKIAALATLKKLGYNPRHRSTQTDESKTGQAAPSVRSSSGTVTGAGTGATATGAGISSAKKADTHNKKSKDSSNSVLVDYPLNSAAYSQPSQELLQSVASTIELSVLTSKAPAGKVTGTTARGRSGKDTHDQSASDGDTTGDNQSGCFSNEIVTTVGSTTKQSAYLVRGMQRKAFMISPICNT
jgi:hypothetical protein